MSQMDLRPGMRLRSKSNGAVVTVLKVHQDGAVEVRVSANGRTSTTNANYLAWQYRPVDESEQAS